MPERQVPYVVRQRCRSNNSQNHSCENHELLLNADISQLFSFQLIVPKNDTETSKLCVKRVCTKSVLKAESPVFYLVDF
jgi:hypothetical protein